jgi:lambda repressor-like predicted transcriptional regulator
MGTRSDIVSAEGSKLQDILDKRGLTMTAVSRMAKVSIEVVRKLRDGKTVRRDKFFAVINSLEVRPQEIIPTWGQANDGNKHDS